MEASTLSRLFMQMRVENRIDPKRSFKFFQDLIAFGVKTWPATNEPVTEPHQTSTTYGIADGYP